MDIKNIKLRYDIIGNDPRLELALNKAIQVAPTDLSILITGESGVGKDVFSRIISRTACVSMYGRVEDSYRSTAVPFPKVPSRVSSSVMSKGPSQEPIKTAKVISKKPMVAPSFSTRLVNCRWLCRLNCFAYWKTVRLSL